MLYFTNIPLSSRYRFPELILHLLGRQRTSSSFTILAAYIWCWKKSFPLHCETQCWILWFEPLIEMSKMKHFENHRNTHCEVGETFLYIGRWFVIPTTNGRHDTIHIYRERIGVFPPLEPPPPNMLPRQKPHLGYPEATCKIWRDLVQ